MGTAEAGGRTAQQKQLNVDIGWWWRFDRYQLVDGYIRPAPGAECARYDPWEEYHAFHGGAGHTGERKDSKRTRKTAPPYEQLIALVEDMAAEDAWLPDSGQLTPPMERRLIEWCDAHGLLGILEHRAQMFVSPTMAQPSQPLKQPLEQPPVGQRRYYRESNGWQWYFERPKGARISAPSGYVVPDAQLPKDWPRPGVLLRELRGLKCTFEDVSNTWARFFPDIPPGKNEDYPCPTTAEWSEAYAEPLSEFIQGALALRDAFVWIGRKETMFATARQHSTAGIDEFWRVEDDYRAVQKGRELLNALIAPVMPGVSLTIGDGHVPPVMNVAPSVLKDAKLQQFWVSPSLLGSLAMMMAQDIAGNAVVRSCLRCGHPFATTHRLEQHCSRECYRDWNKINLRQKERKARQLAAEGRSPAEIAEQLDSELPVVLWWLNRERVRQMSATGLSYREIAQRLDCDQSLVQEWLNRELARRMAAEGLSSAEIARRLGVKESWARRWVQRAK